MKCLHCGGEWSPPKNISLTICPFCNTPIVENTKELNSSKPYEVIKHIVEQYGADIFLDNKKLSALLIDLITEKTKERNILGIAINANIPSKILKANDSDNKHKEAIAIQCKSILCDDYGMSNHWGEFAVNCFTYALGWKEFVIEPQPEPTIHTNAKPKVNPYISEKNSLISNKSMSVKSLKDIIFSDTSKANEDSDENEDKDSKSDNSIVSKFLKKYNDLKTNIPSNVFNNIIKNNNLISNTIPSTVTSIKYRAFANSKDLISIIIPNSVTSIEPEAFKDCKNLKTVIIPSSVTSIADGAFKGCMNLITIIVDRKNSKYSSDNGMLFNYDKTKLIAYPSAIIADIPNGVTTIGNNAFNDCENLASIILPRSIVSIEYNAFWGCLNLTNIIIDKDNIIYSSKNGIIFDFYKTRLISYPSANINMMDIPNSVNHINYGAFGCCKNLVSISLPNSIVSIGNYAFFNCINLKTINISSRTAFISDSAFEGCTSLTNIVVDRKNMRYSSEGGILFNRDRTTIISYPSANGDIVVQKGVSCIGDSAFLGCKNLISATLPDSVTSIGYMAFANCTNLESIIVSTNLDFIGKYAFIECTNLTVYCKGNAYVEKYCKENNIKINLLL